MVGLLMAESIFPFLPNGASAPPQNFPYDVVINDAYPGIQFIPTEPNGEYQEIREVSGNLWLVTNAMWNANLLQWDQESPQNTGLPAYALELGADGSMTRWESPPTNIPFTPITWTRLFQVDNKGQVISVPLTVLTANQASQQIFVVWDPGVGTQVEGRLLQVTDVASAANSLLDNLVVNGVAKWSVDKNGVLVTGSVPASSIINLFVSPTFTGTSTFNGPVVMNSTLDVFGAGTFHSSLTADSTFFVVGLSTLNGHANINSGLTVTGGEGVTGGLTTDTLHVTGAATVDASLTANSTLDVIGHTQLANVTVSGTLEARGTVVTQAGNQVAPPNTAPMVITGPNTGSWDVFMTVVVEMTAPLAAGTVTVTGVGGSGSWNGTSRTITNPGTSYITVLLRGASMGTDTISATVTATGGVINVFDYSMLANRFL
jgi:hypothetical protein